MSHGLISADGVVFQVLGRLQCPVFTFFEGNIELGTFVAAADV